MHEQSPSSGLSLLTRAIPMVAIPLFTLALGWQLGMRYQQKEFRELRSTVEQLYAVPTGSGTTMGDPQENVDISLLWSVWRLLQSHYIEPEDMGVKQMVYGAVQGMVSAIGDPYTVFMTPQENTDFRDSLSGHLQGIGAELTQRDEGIVVVAPIKGSPAERAGLMPEDLIIAVDGEPLEAADLQEAVSRIRGNKGTDVVLTIVREGEAGPLTFTITRDDITVPSTSYEVKQTATGSIGYLEINQFGTETVQEVRSIVSSVDPETVDGLIIDLRFNGGGYLEGAVDIVSLFVEEGTVVSVARREGEDERHEVSGDPVLPDLPLAVLINQGSASASEIVAGALQDHDRAQIVGMQSFGKGTVQEVIELPGGTSLRVTTAKWLTPDGRDLGKEGVTPDIVVDRTREDIDAGVDPQLDAAMASVLDR